MSCQAERGHQENDVGDAPEKRIGSRGSGGRKLIVAFEFRRRKPQFRFSQQELHAQNGVLKQRENHFIILPDSETWVRKR